MKWYLKVLNNYVTFEGRARREEYWMFILFHIIFLITAMVLDNVLGLTLADEIGYGYIYLIYSLGLLLPGLAVAVRRLHDVGKSGWFILIALIPLIGSIWLLVLYCTDSEHGENKWGPNPKGIGNKTDIDQIGQE